MADRPILFSGPMVRALLNGSKTQTRRVVKPTWPAHAQEVSLFDDGRFQYADMDGWHDAPAPRCPYGAPGDRLWVRETFAKIDGQTQPWIETDYRATYTHGDRLGDSLGIKKRWTPAIHMPRAASRITLDVTGVRVERLQYISEADARAEGSPCVDEVSGREVLFPDASKCGTFKLGYRCVWEEINGPGSWDANPWVWVIEFRRAA